MKIGSILVASTIGVIALAAATQLGRPGPGGSEGPDGPAVAAPALEQDETSLPPPALGPEVLERLAGSDADMHELARELSRHDEDGLYRPELDALARRLGVAVESEGNDKILDAIDALSPGVEAAAYHTFCVAQECMDDLWRSGEIQVVRTGAHDGESTNNDVRLDRFVQEGVAFYVTETNVGPWSVSLVIDGDRFPDYADARAELKRRVSEREALIHEMLRSAARGGR